MVDPAASRSPLLATGAAASAAPALPVVLEIAGLAKDYSLGNERISVLNLEVVRADPERGLLLVRGAVPGPEGGLVMIRSAVKAPAAARGV